MMIRLIIQRYKSTHVFHLALLILVISRPVYTRVMIWGRKDNLIHELMTCIFASHLIANPVPCDSRKTSFPPGTCDGGIFTYEKTTGHFLRTAAQDPLQTDNTAPGITSECSKLCSGEGSDCPAFAVDYAGQRCFKLDRNTQVR